MASHKGLGQRLHGCEVNGVSYTPGPIICRTVGTEAVLVPLASTDIPGVRVKVRWRGDNTLKSIGAVFSDGSLEGCCIHGRQEVAGREILHRVDTTIRSRRKIECTRTLPGCGLETLTQCHADCREAWLVGDPVEKTAVVAEGDQVLESVGTRHDAW